MMTHMNSHPPGSNIHVEMTPEMAAFVLENCDANIGVGLSLLQSVSRETTEKLVDKIERFRALKQAVKDAAAIVTYRWSHLIDDHWDRFVSHIDARGPFECWCWTGAKSIGGQKNKSNHAPYGTFTIDRSLGFVVRAHIFMLEAGGIFVPPGWHRNHLCHNTLCMNLLHIEPVTAEENYADRRKGVSARYKEAA